MPYSSFLNYNTILAGVMNRIGDAFTITPSFQNPVTGAVDEASPPVLGQSI